MPAVQNQTRFGISGNCIQACVSTITGVPMDQVPDFAADRKTWLKDLLQWCAGRGHVCRFTQNRAEIAAHQGWAMVQGKAARGNKHAVVYLGAYMAHDPHPSRQGLITAEDAVLFD